MSRLPEPMNPPTHPVQKLIRAILRDGTGVAGQDCGRPSNAGGTVSPVSNRLLAEYTGSNTGARFQDLRNIAVNTLIHAPKAVLTRWITAGEHIVSTSACDQLFFFGLC